MPSPGWYDENRRRAYPFVRETVHRALDGPLTLRHLPNEIVVDAGFVLGVFSQFDPVEHSVWLARIVRSGDWFTFEFESDAPGLYDTPLRFTRNVADPKQTLEFADSGDTGLSESSLSAYSESHADAEECREPLWSGFLVTGDLTELDAFLAGDGTVDRGTDGATVEPARLQSLAGASVNHFGVANDDRTRAQTSAGEDCPETEYPFTPGLLRVYDACVLGRVAFKAGFNSVVRQNPLENSITFGAAVGAGAGEPCEELPLFPEEAPPDGSNLLTGGPQCNEVLRSINGVAGPRFTIEGGSGVTITAEPASHKIRIDVDMSGLAVCYHSESLGDD